MAWTTLSAAGAKLRASEYRAVITELRPLAARKASDEIVNASAVMQDDNELTVAVEANSIYVVNATLFYSSNTTPDISVQWSAPTSSTFRWTAWGQGSGATTFEGVIKNEKRDLTEASTIGGAGTSTVITIRPSGLLITSSTAGTFKLQWAQGTSNASDTTMTTGSFMELRKVQT